jgi:hypothetical protein
MQHVPSLLLYASAAVFSPAFRLLFFSVSQSAVALPEQVCCFVVCCCGYHAMGYVCVSTVLDERPSRHLGGRDARCTLVTVPRFVTG